MSFRRLHNSSTFLNHYGEWGASSQSLERPLRSNLIELLPAEGTDVVLLPGFGGLRSRVPPPPRHDKIAVARHSDLQGFGLRVLKTPVRAPKASAFCERLIGTIRRECLGFLIPINERHLARIVKEFMTHYDRGRPHSALGPGIPEPPQAKVPAGPHRHQLPAECRVESTPVLGGLHHEYRLEKEAA
ncbi:MAG: hypothetical protein C0504_19990 [Candidatus Solibacter sp.]|nr:hypothetical protein [Candidatus Solibacter sp.]